MKMTIYAYFSIYTNTNSVAHFFVKYIQFDKNSCFMTSVFTVMYLSNESAGLWR